MQHGGLLPGAQLFLVTMESQALLTNVGKAEMRYKYSRSHCTLWERLKCSIVQFVLTALCLKAKRTLS